MISPVNVFAGFWPYTIPAARIKADEQNVCLFIMQFSYCDLAGINPCNRETIFAKRCTSLAAWELREAKMRRADSIDLSCSGGARK
jgi:hypothetical protein